ncbi:MAG: lycopene cyclase domain-containing protein [Ardenticatenaceae bacterium]|nr:lycopene cyclase domain-containing protein [Anaerolineales bacterium]MCB8922564.1 lycopene cyclase domain-containing protein [Ardenticatenaceae bacterium]MCB8991232.1 lycopene cyclase domain-containing protein [Ardenticatenaceae bacterium]
MSYFVFLLRFLMIPIAVLLGLAWWDKRRGRETAVALRSWPVSWAIALHVLVALIYTTPWDNYLVATRVWWYDPALVTGITLGWVPIEEYTFFILQPILGGLWLHFLMQNTAYGLPVTDDGLRIRLWSVAVLGVVWFGTAVILITGWQPGTYLALELVWALPPIMLQLGFGADILWQNRRIVFLSIVPLTLYLSAADALAIHWGTWTIDPAQSLNIYIGNVLPLEELIFFLLTNTLITFGIILICAQASHARLTSLKRVAR